jgi:hypothetical protein
MSQAGFPWINIPMFADEGEPQIFVGRREELSVLYRALVAAGNAVRAGRFGIHRKFVVHGGLGVGKSALILEALRLLRDPSAARSELTEGLPDPEEPERWLILRISGKHVTGLDGLATSLSRTLLSDEGGGDSDATEQAFHPRLALFEHVRRQAENVAPEVLHLAPMHRLLRTHESQLYDKVRADLHALALAIDETVRRASAASQAAHAGSPESALAVALREQAEAHELVGALNRFFRAATAAGLPTFLIFDDFDELAVTAGAPAAARARTLSLLLHEFHQLMPTCLLLSLRSEFMDETILRQFRRIFVPPLSKKEAVLLLARWAQAQQPALSAEATQRWQQLGERFLQRFTDDEPVVVPFRFLQLTAWLANNLLIYDLSEADSARMLWRYFGSKYPLDVVRALRALIALVPDEHIQPSAAASPVDAAPYQSLSHADRDALQRASLLRPAFVAAADSARIVLDPLVAYLRDASNRASGR